MRITPRLAVPLLLCGLLAACTAPRPTGGVAVDGDGDVTGAVGVRGDRAAVGVNTDGEVGARVDVVDTGNARVTVGTGGASASVRPGRLRVGVGGGGVRLGF